MRLRQRPDDERGRRASTGRPDASAVPKPAFVRRSGRPGRRRAPPPGIPASRSCSPSQRVDGGRSVGRTGREVRRVTRDERCCTTTSGGEHDGRHHPDVAADRRLEVDHRWVLAASSMVQARRTGRPSPASAWIESSVGRSSTVPPSPHAVGTCGCHRAARSADRRYTRPRWTSTSSRRSRHPPSGRRSTPSCAGDRAAAERLARRRPRHGDRRPLARGGHEARAIGTCSCRRSTASRHGSA